MCKLEEKLKNVGPRWKAGQKLNRKRGISETKFQSGQGQGQESKEDILSRAQNFIWGPRGP